MSSSRVAPLAVAIPSLIGSFSSLLACTVFAVLYACFPPKRHFRQVLVVNLLVADWINAFNNSVSGFYVVVGRRDLEPGAACTANGYIGQLSVQAIDFNILVIAISVLLTVRKNTLILEQSWQKIVIVCAIPWIMPIITSNIALALHLYGPVTGNWCWIEASYFGERYALTHGWRIAIFLATIVIYTTVYVRLKQIYGRLAVTHSTSATAMSAHQHTIQNITVVDEVQLSSSSHVELEDLEERPLRQHGAVMSMRDHASGANMKLRDEAYRYDATVTSSKVPVTHTEDATTPEESHTPTTPKYKEHGALPPSTTLSKPAYVRPTQELRRMLLLNGYPILYIILWIPGIANRIYEAFGPSPLWLQGLQSSTQWMGVADVLTYAYNEQIHKRVREAWRERSGGHRLRD